MQPQQKKFSWSLAIAVLALFVSGGSLWVSYLTFQNDRRESGPQAELLVDRTLQNISEGPLYLSVICRTTLDITNLGSTATRIESVSTAFLMRQLVDVQAVNLSYDVNFVTPHAYESFSDKGVNVMTALYNWGQSPPKIANLHSAIREFGQEFLTKFPLADYRFISFDDLNQVNDPYYQNEFGIRKHIEISIPPLLFRQPAQPLINGKQITTITLDYITFFVSLDPTQADRIHSYVDNEKIPYTITFVDGNSSSHTINCGPIYEDAGVK